MERLEIPPDARVLILTGAGVSAESGVPTFRGAGGRWESERIEEVASPQGFHRDPQRVWRFYSERRARAKDVLPNPGHVAIAQLERRLSERFLLVTQNVDGLHARAGSQRLIEIHGSLFETKCSKCHRPAFADEAQYLGALPECAPCAGRGVRALLRPNVVWFGETLRGEDLARIDAFFKAADRRLIFLAVGTSGAVYPAAGLVEHARRSGAGTWLVNLEPPENAGEFEHVLLGPSGQILPTLLGA